VDERREGESIRVYLRKEGQLLTSTARPQTNIAGPVVCLFFGGTSIMIIYSSVLSYLVDANVGRSSVSLFSLRKPPNRGRQS
jgi:hypothetical protein